jgi:hypothetical protein
MKKLISYVVFNLIWLVPVTKASPVQWSIADGGNGHYYEAVLVSEGISWTNANIAASSKEGNWHLATITSAEENAFVYDLVDDDPAFWKRGGTSGNWGGPWIGGYQVDDTGPWYWVTGEPFIYTNWGPREPFGNGDKIALFGYQTTKGPYWNDACDIHMYFGYVIESETIPPPSEIRVSIDIKPGSCPNPFNPKSQGRIPVAIVATEDFDPTTAADLSTIQLIGVSPIDAEVIDSTQPGDYDPEDCYNCFNADDYLTDSDGDGVFSYEGDGNPDLVLYFDAQELVAAIAQAEKDACLELELIAETADGVPIVGSDSIWITKAIGGE